MRNTKICPKCNSTDILKMPGLSGGFGSGNNIQTGMSIFSAVKVTRYLCCECGYSEEWIDNKEDINKLQKKFK